MHLIWCSTFFSCDSDYSKPYCSSDSRKILITVLIVLSVLAGILVVLLIVLCYRRMQKKRQEAWVVCFCYWKKKVYGAREESLSESFRVFHGQVSDPICTFLSTKLNPGKWFLPCHIIFQNLSNLSHINIMPICIYLSLRVVSPEHSRYCYYSDVLSQNGLFHKVELFTHWSLLVTRNNVHPRNVFLASNTKIKHIWCV